MWCKILSAIVSVNSTFGHERDCGRLIEKIGKEHGMNVEIMPVTEDRLNVMITVGADNFKKKNLGLALESAPQRSVDSYYLRLGLE